MACIQCRKTRKDNSSMNVWTHRKVAQPRDGEKVLHCGHVVGTHQFFFSSDGAGHRLALCQECFVRFAHCPEDVIRAEMVWNKVVEHEHVDSPKAIEAPSQ